MAAVAEPRRAAKVLLVDRDDAVLLFRGGDPTRPADGTWWFPPGGGIDPGESVEEAARREVLEETGLVVGELGPVIAHRSTEFEFVGRLIRSDETYFAVSVDRFEPDGSGWTPIERASIVEHRWWTLDELRSTDETVYPERVVEFVNAHRSS